jgi:hypothetical protein
MQFICEGMIQTKKSALQLISPEIIYFQVVQKSAYIYNVDTKKAQKSNKEI